jgi:hypothetical protein
MVTRQEALNDAYDRLKDIWFNMEPIFAEHGPMVAEAISTLGRDAAIGPWVEAYKANHRHLPPPPNKDAIDPAKEDEWRAGLGAAPRTLDWLDLFRNELAVRPWQETIRLWAPRLIDGYIGGLTHGLIRTAHAVRAIPESGASAAEIEELARGLAYWAAIYRELPPLAEGGAPAEPEEAISRHSARFARLLLAEGTRAGVPLIQLIHTVTSAQALRTLLPFLAREVAQRGVVRIAQGSASVATRVTGRPPGEPKPQIPEPALEIDELIDRSIAHGDDHVIKFTEAALREDRLRPDPVYRATIEMLQRQIQPGA